MVFIMIKAQKDFLIQIIKLTNYEEEFFDLLIVNLNQFISLNEIYNHIVILWKI